MRKLTYSRIEEADIYFARKNLLHVGLAAEIPILFASKFAINNGINSHIRHI
jgi:hypothetical protein